MEIKNKLQIKNRYVILSFLILLVVLVITMSNITSLMEVLETCVDDFAIIERCKCAPWWK